jgi:hypothetical protein
VAAIRNELPWRPLNEYPTHDVVVNVLESAFVKAVSPRPHYLHAPLVEFLPLGFLKQREAGVLKFLGEFLVFVAVGSRLRALRGGNIVWGFAL